MKRDTNDEVPPTPGTEKNPTETKPTKEPKSPAKEAKPPRKEMTKNHLYILLAVLSFAVLGLCGYLIWNAYQPKCVKVTPPPVIHKETEDDSSVEDENDTEEEDDDTGSAAHPSYELDIGSSDSLTVPDGWYVDKIVSDYSMLTEEEQNNYLNPENQGLWPIHSETKILLTNDRSVITIRHAALFIPGATGFMPSAITDDYTVVKEPTADSEGYAYTLADGKYSFENIYLCEEPCAWPDDGFPDPEKKFLTAGGLATQYIFTFSGDEDDLDIAKSIYEDNYLDEQISFTIED